MIAPTCDVPGCGMPSDLVTDGKEEDVQGLSRPAIPKIAVCGRHHNWPHSKDATDFASGAFAFTSAADNAKFQNFKAR